jgi:hypothetical protein
MASIAPLGLVGSGIVLAAGVFSLGWMRAARFRSERGRAPWAIPPVIWGAVHLVLLPVGWVVFFAAARTSKVVDPSLAYRENIVIADTAEERERLRRISAELPLLRPPQPDTRGWHSDPVRQRRFRFYDGKRWTREVSDDPARLMAAAVGDVRADLRRRLQALPPPRESGACWHVDPLGTYYYRYFDGHEWTEQVRQARHA